MQCDESGYKKSDIMINNKSKDELFYMIYVEDSGAPRKMHNCFSDAKEEATRLSQNNIGKKVFILMSTCYCITKLPEPEFTVIRGG